MLHVELIVRGRHVVFRLKAGLRNLGARNYENSGAVLVGNLDTDQSERVLFLVARCDDFEQDLIKLALTAVEGSTIASGVRKLDQLHTPLAQRRVIRNMHGDIKRGSRGILFRWNNQLSGGQ